MIDIIHLTGTTRYFNGTEYTFYARVRNEDVKKAKKCLKIKGWSVRTVQREGCTYIYRARTSANQSAFLGKS